MLSSPNLATPLDVEIGELLSTNPKKFATTAKEWTKKHAA
jgi:ubiquitin-protein ligase